MTSPKIPKYETLWVYFTKNSWFIDLVVLSLMLMTFYLLFLGSHALINPDEARYSGIAQAMLATGDFITPKVNGAIFFDKPILYYWLQASSIALFGVHEWALRLWPAIFGVTGCLFLYLAGRLIFNRLIGWMSACALACTALYYGGSHFANMDLEVAVLISGSLLMFLISTQDHLQHLRRPYLYASYLLAGLAVLTKGLIGIAFPIMIIGLWIIFTNQWALVKRMYIPQGLLIIVAVVAPWMIAVQYYHPEFLYTFFYIQHIQRFIATNFNAHEPFWFYLPVVLIGTLPFSGLMICAVGHYLRLIWQDKLAYKNELFLVIWAVVVFVFFSSPKSKIIGYILPVIPPLIFLTTIYLSKYIDKPAREIIKGNLIGLIAFLIVLAISIFILPHIPYIAAQNFPMRAVYPVGASCLIAAMITAYGLTGTVRKAFITLCVSVACMLLMTSAMLPLLHLQSTKPLLKKISPELKSDDKIVAFYIYFYDLPIYTGKQVYLVANWDKPTLRQKDNWRGLFANARVSDPEAKKWLIEEKQLWSVWQEPGRIFLFTKKHWLPEIEQKTQGKLYILGTEGKIVLISNHEQ